VTTLFNGGGGGGGGGTLAHNPVWVSSSNPGKQNGAQPLVTPVSPGRQAELTAGDATVTTAIGAAASAATESAPITSRRSGCNMVDS